MRHVCELTSHTAACIMASKVDSGKSMLAETLALFTMAWNCDELVVKSRECRKEYATSQSSGVSLSNSASAAQGKSRLQVWGGERVNNNVIIKLWPQAVFHRGLVLT